METNVSEQVFIIIVYNNTYGGGGFRTPVQLDARPLPGSTAPVYGVIVLHYLRAGIPASGSVKLRPDAA